MISKEKSKFDSSFDKDALNYDNVRPKYPSELFEDIFTLTKFNKEMKVLEIGAGTGIATEPFAKKGAEVIAIEPGEQLSNVLKSNLNKYSNVKVKKVTFEDLRMPKKKYDLIVSATSFHWLKGRNQLEKFYKTESLLDDNGYLVLFWDSFCNEENFLSKEINLIYKEELSDIYNTEKSVNENVLDKIIKREKEIIGNNHFYIMQIRRYKTTYTYKSFEYIDLLKTYPKIINLDPNRKEKFLNRIYETIENNGSEIKIPVITSLYILKKKKSFPII